MRRLALVFAGLALLASCVQQPHTDSGQPKLGFVGDSITVLSEADINAHYPAYDVSILAVTGAQARDLVAGVRDEAATHPAAMIINVGTNDAAHGATDTAAKLDEMVALTSDVPCVVFVTVNAHNPSWGPNSAMAYNAKIRTFSHVVDWDAAWNSAWFDYPDNPHPNATGRQALLEAEDQALSECG